MSRQTWQLVFLTGAVFNLLVAAAFGLAPGLTLSLLGFAEGLPANPLWYALVWWLVTVFGVGYYMVSRDPEGNRGIAVMGLIGKFGFWVVTTTAWAMGHAPLLFMLLVCADLVYSLLFLWFLRSEHQLRAASLAH